MSESEGGSGLTADERELAGRLEAGRAVPAGEFRGALARHLAARNPGHGPRPERLHRITALYLAAGGTLLALGALQATGVL